MFTINLNRNITLTPVASGLIISISPTQLSGNVHTAHISVPVLTDILSEIEKLNSSGTYATFPDTCIGLGIDGI